MQLLVLNPTEVRKMARRRRSSKGRFVRGGHHRKARKNPVARRRSHHRRRARRSNPVVAFRRHHRRRYRSNPVGGGLFGIATSALVPAVVGAGGGLVVDVAVNMGAPSFLPASMQTPMAKNLLKLGIAGLGIPLLGGLVLKRDQVLWATTGALTVIVARMAASFISQQWPTLPLGEYVHGMEGMGAGFRPRARSMTAVRPVTRSAAMLTGRSMGEYVGSSRGAAAFVPGMGTT